MTALSPALLRKITGYLSVGFGLYALAVAILAVAYETVAFFIVFALIILIFASIYIISGIAMLMDRRGQFFSFIGVFGSVYWWGTGMPWYFWPMFIMPPVILVLTIVLFISDFSQES